MTVVPLGNFMIGQVSVEYRFAPSYRMWDTVGRFWSDMHTLFGPMEPQTATPSHSAFLAGDRYTLTVQIDRMGIVDGRPPKDIDENVNIMLSFFRKGREYFMPDILTRVGTRVLYIKHFDDEKLRDDYLSSLRLSLLPGGNLFGVKSAVVKPRYQVEWSDGDIGVLAQVYNRSRHVEVKSMPDFPGMETFSKHSHEVIVDLDFFTTQSVTIEAFDLRSWLERWRRALRRDFERFVQAGGVS